MLVLYHSQTLKHRTIEVAYSKVQDALECPERISAILTALKDTHHEVRTVNYSTEPPTIPREVSETHDAQYLHHLAHSHADWVKAGAIKQDESLLPECFPFPTSTARPDEAPKDMYARAGYFAFDMSTGIMSETYKSALASANLAVEGVKLLRHATTTSSGNSPTDSSVLALCRPPGHHCDTRRAGGYCYINNAVVAVSAIRHLVSSSSVPAKINLDHSQNPIVLPTHNRFHPQPPTSPNSVRIAILDLDYHHGNGTQTHFYTDPHVLYTSIHGQHEFPYYTGSADETGPPFRPSTTNLNVPLPPHSSVSTYLSALDQVLDKITSFAPAWLVVSLGFDTFHRDPIGSFDLQTTDYEQIATRIREEKNLRQVPALLLLEGGYVLEELGGCCVGFLKGWEGQTQGSGRDSLTS